MVSMFHTGVYSGLTGDLRSQKKNLDWKMISIILYYIVLYVVL